MSPPIFSGKRRQRKTRAAVRWADRLSRWLIVTGGIGTVLAVSMVCIFLVYVVVPLFLPAKVGPQHGFDWTEPRPLRLQIDDYESAACVLGPDGSVSLLRLDNGQQVDQQKFLVGQGLSAAAFDTGGTKAAFGFGNGTVRLGTIDFVTEFIPAEKLPKNLRSLPLGELREYDHGLLARTAGDQLRVERLLAKTTEPLALGLTSGIRRLDISERSEGPLLSLLTEDGQLHLVSVTRRENLLTGEAELESELSPIPLKEAAPERPLPDYLLLSGLGDNVYAAWSDGTLLRFDTADPKNPRLAEKCSLVADPTVRLTALEFALGKTTLVSGDSQGRVRAWFRDQARGNGNQRRGPARGGPRVSAHGRGSHGAGPVGPPSDDGGGRCRGRYPHVLSHQRAARRAGAVRTTAAR